MADDSKHTIEPLRLWVDGDAVLASFAIELLLRLELNSCPFFETARHDEDDIFE